MWCEIIEKQMNPFVGFKVNTEAINHAYHEATESLRIKIRSNNIVSVQKNSDTMETTRVRGYVALIEDTLKFHKIPDMEFLISLPDFPISYFRQPGADIPIFSFCKREDHRTALLPFPRFGRDEVNLSYCKLSWSDWPSWEKVVENITALNATAPWEKKLSKAIFAGHAYDWAGSRIRYGMYALEAPDIFESYITDTPQGTDYIKETELKRLIGNPIPMAQYVRYKYLMHIDGNTSSERLRYLLAFNSVVIKTDSPWYEFYYPLLKPLEHYVPIKPELDDLMDTIHALEANPHVAQHIAENGVQFVKEKLRYQNVLQYVAEILLKYADLH